MKIQGSDMSWPKDPCFVTKDLLRYGKYERTLEELRNWIKSTDVVVDVGAHYGYYTCMFAQLAKYVTAFEPSPKNLAWLYKNVNQNHYQNVRICSAACGDKDGAIDLYLSDICTGMNRVYPSVFCSSNKVRATLQRVDGIVTHADVVKIDVEGYEWEVLNGMTDILDRVRVLFIEHNPPMLRDEGLPIPRVLKFLELHNFQIKICGHNLTCTKDV